jgi:PKD repeat protein
MRKIVQLASIFSLFFITGLNAQENSMNRQNMRDGETIEYCKQHIELQKKLLDSAFAVQFYANQAKANQQAKSKIPGTEKGIVYKIPVVFHVLHNGGVENISRDQILDALAILNRDYRLQNADAANVHNDFNANNPNAVCQPTDVEIEFVLATKAPDGTCFGGITRTYSPMSYQGSNGALQVDAIIAGNDVYQGAWPGNMYMNIFVCGDVGGAAGYTFLPYEEVAQMGMYNGIHLLHSYTGSIGTSQIGASRTLTHETAHWFNLEHTWGYNNAPGVACGDDDVSDTPITRGVTSCSLNENFCGVRANVENYMDYSYCGKMFTAGQVDRMRAAAVSTTGGRNNLSTAENLATVGADGNVSLCKVDFTTSKNGLCAGESIQFNDVSYNGIASRTWTFEGGTPATSTNQDPIITYNTPGVYTVTLTASDGISTETETKTSYIHVFQAAETLPFFEGFEGISNLDQSERWLIYNAGENNEWSINNLASHSGSQSVRLENFDQSAGNLDELSSTTIDLSNVSAQTGATLSFRFAHRKRSADNTEYLKVYFSNDCGEDWVLRKTLVDNTLSNLIDTTSWVPEALDWKTVHVTNVTSAYWVDNFRFKFRFESDGGNNLYLDDINIYQGAPSDDIIAAGISEQEQLQNISLFPNPAEKEIALAFKSPAKQHVVVSICDVLGNVITNHAVEANEGENTLFLTTETLAGGIYMITFNGLTTKQNLRFIKN